MKLKARLVTGVLFITLVACGLLVLNGNLRVAVEFTADPAAGQGAGRAAQGAETSRYGGKAAVGPANKKLLNEEYGVNSNVSNGLSAMSSGQNPNKSPEKGIHEENKIVERPPTVAHKLQSTVQKNRTSQKTGILYTGSKLRRLFQNPLYNIPERVSTADYLLKPARWLHATAEERKHIKLGENSGEDDNEEVLHEKKPWRLLQFGITRYSLYARNDPNVEEVLKAIRTQEVTYVEMKPGGTQLKLFMEFEDTSIGLFKPWRWPRDRETPPDHFYFTDYERHNAEIAAYHLDRILDFRRCPPVSGRWFNVTSEIRQKSEDEKLLKTFFVSPVGNVCFFGDCSYYCNTEHMICAIKDHHMLEGSVAAYLPRWQEAPRKTWKHPWKRSYSRVRKADWEVTDGEAFCRQVRSTPPYDKGRRFGDLLDLTVYDFLMGNMDRHHYETFKAFGNNSAPIHLDQGRAFGRTTHDEISILVPIYSCCSIRKSTWLRLQLLAKEDYRLSDVMRESMRTDPIAPILTEPHLLALDRRVGIILDTVAKCIQKKGAENVLLEDLKDT
ncbi:extracellular serine/threonine protein kinase FAM20C-like isoform X3 [Branchiostoma floridae]|uniref:Extracellular serine/threonine protein kinase FAM20C-like isoform X3 n=1 Tax=Branchiostoma floridae TaxID=7739 RepID=A0A9J7N6T5_BRAFL|nr:extracellular serine/threonine protein kinase FAM20C-like isoform X3 [Branchiostoma floridae]